LTTAFVAFFSAYITFTSAVPAQLDAVLVTTDAPLNVTKLASSQFLPQADDEWTMVIFNGAESGGQCGGTEILTTSASGTQSCTTLSQLASCAKISVGINTPIISCKFDFDGSACPAGGHAPAANLKPGGSATVSVPDVKFVGVFCTDWLVEVVARPSAEVRDVWVWYLFPCICILSVYQGKFYIFCTEDMRWKAAEVQGWRDFDFDVTFFTVW
jgi:hypothetical protein